MYHLITLLGTRYPLVQDWEMKARFDVINWVTLPNQSFVKQKVGNIDLQASADQTLSINEDIILWDHWFKQVELKCRGELRKNA